MLGPIPLPEVVVPKPTVIRVKGSRGLVWEPRAASGKQAYLDHRHAVVHNELGRAFGLSILNTEGFCDED